MIADTQPWVGSGKIQDDKPKSEKSEHPTTTETVEIDYDPPVANDYIGNDIPDKLESTIEEIEEMISGGAEITKQQLIEWGKTLKDIVVGESESKTKDSKIKEEKEEDADNEDNDKKEDDEEDADEENGEDYDGRAQGSL